MVSRLVLVYELLPVDDKISRDIENEHLETFIATWQSNLYFEYNSENSIQFCIFKIYFLVIYFNYIMKVSSDDNWNFFFKVFFLLQIVWEALLKSSHFWNPPEQLLPPLESLNIFIYYKFIHTHTHLMTPYKYIYIYISCISNIWDIWDIAYIWDIYIYFRGSFECISYFCYALTIFIHFHIPSS